MTTILCVRHNGKAAIGGDGQVTLGNTVVKHQAVKIRRLHDGKVFVGFAGATADAFALIERFEKMLQSFQGSTRKAAVELAKEWRTDRVLRRLESQMIAADKDASLLISGVGDVIEPDDGVLAIGSGGPFALAAARGLIKHSALDAKAIVLESLQIASRICIFSNDQIHVEEVA